MMMCIVVLLAGLAGWGCGDKKDKAVAKVDGKKITVQQVEAMVQGSLPAGQPTTDPERKRALDKLIYKTVLLNEADQNGVMKDKIVLQRIEDEKDRVILDELIRRQLPQIPVVTDEEVQKYYQEVYRKKVEKPLPLDRIKEPLRQQLVKGKQMAAFAALIKGLRARAKITIDEEVLKSVK
jgi:hypothetical protein